jgi:hypothetical protein
MKQDEQELVATPEIVVFSILKAGTCADCQTELSPGELLRMERERPLCIDCADLGHLLFLPRGNVALTRRSRKYSSLSAVVLRFSRARGRYERQGLLVERAAVERAEAECLSDEDARRVARERAAAHREKVDAKYIEEFAGHVRGNFPGCPHDEALSIATHACEKYTSRVGRSASAKSFDPTAVELAVKAHIRHVHTTYDSLLAQGWERDEARAKIAGSVAEIVERWRRGISLSEMPVDRASKTEDQLRRPAPPAARR